MMLSPSNLKPSHWDMTYDDDYLEQWLYGPQSLNGATRKWLIEQIAKTPRGESFLDLGCGGGVTAYHLREAGLLDHVVYTGVDITNRMINLARRKIPQASFIHSPIEHFALTAKGGYDSILLRAVLEHLENPLPVIDAASKLLREGGTFYLIFWNNPVESESLIFLTEDGFYDNAFNATLLRERFEGNGLTIQDTLILPEPSARSQDREIWIMKKREQ